MGVIKWEDDLWEFLIKEFRKAFNETLRKISSETFIAMNVCPNCGSKLKLVLATRKLKVFKCDRCKKEYVVRISGSNS